MSKEELLKTAKPILFNTEMVKAILDGRKTQTRRAISENVYYRLDDETKKLPYVEKYIEELINDNAKYKKGDILWVREPAKVVYAYDSIKRIKFIYKADDTGGEIDIPSRFMDNHSAFAHTKWIKNCKGVPNGCIKEMARIFLKVTDVRVERLQDISVDNIQKEGLRHNDLLLKNGVTIETQLRRDWITLWNSTAKDGYKWEDNPYIFVYEFDRAEVD